MSLRGSCSSTGYLQIPRISAARILRTVLPYIPWESSPETTTIHFLIAIMFVYSIKLDKKIALTFFIYFRVCLVYVLYLA